MRWATLAWVSVLLAAAPASAQRTHARRLVPRGEVTGLEMGIDGSLTAIPGGRVRWFVTLYEVLARRDLRPAAGATLRVSGAFAPADVITTVRTDAGGHATLDIPLSAEVFFINPTIMVEAESPAHHVRRVFSVTLTSGSPHELELFTDREVVRPGATVAVLGRLVERATRRPLAEESVEVRLWSNGQIGEVLTAITDAHGVFVVRAPVATSTAGVVRISATTDYASAEDQIEVATAVPDGLWIDAAPAVTSASVGERVPVHVRVRTSEGVPVAGARVAWSDAGRPADGETSPDRSTTDHEGRALLEWALPAHLTEPRRVLTRDLTVVDPARGTGRRMVTLPVARVPVLVAWAVDGGALVPGLGGRVYVRVLRPDGTPHEGEVTLDAPRFGGASSARLDEDGVASFDGRVGAGTRLDGCGGANALRATLAVGAHREAFCLPVDPDATLRVTRATPRRAPESTLDVVFERVPHVRGARVELTALALRSGAWVPVARVHLDARENRTSLVLPPEARGEIWVRARPIFAGGGAARGGGRTVFVSSPRDELRVRASEAGAQVESGGEGTVALFASEDRALLSQLRARLGPVGTAVDEGRTEGYVRALLAARTPIDVAASMVWQGGSLVPQPMPQQPAQQGLLRSPWRARARFVRGRVGRLMRAVEDYVDRSVPEGLDEVAIRERGRWRFNRAVLDGAIARSALGDETGTSLDGEPVTIEVLRTMDPAFSFDNVARRLTRRRLFRVLVMLREASLHLGLDRPWARRGDASEIPVSVLDLGASLGVPFSSDPRYEDFFDAWGQPLVLRPARGRGRGFLEPIDGWELVSVGPDGRAGTRDDLVDPFARVLPSSGLYADAVGEDVLLARLNGVVLGRVTLSALAEIFEFHAEPADVAESSAHSTFEQLPVPPVAPLFHAPAVEPLERPIGGLEGALEWSFPSERRGYFATAVRFGPNGELASATARFEAGAPWVVRLEMPEVLRPGDVLRVPVSRIRLAEGGEDPSLRVTVRGRAVTARADEGGGHVVLEASRPGFADVTVVVQVGERTLGRFEQRMRVVPDGWLRSLSRTVRIDGEGELALRTPAGATAWRRELTVGAPRSLRADPVLAAHRARAPALFAWAGVLAGDTPDRTLLTSTLSASGPLQGACAVVAWAADEAFAGRVSGRAQSIRVDRSDLATRASVLAALATAVPRAPSGDDPLVALTAQLRADGWRAVATASDQPAVMARMAAALLLVDRRDAPGRALLERVEASLERDGRGRRWVPGDPERAADGWIGTLALSIAARQTGRDELADELAAAALSRMYLVRRAGDEGVFWALAASVYGALGVDGPEAVEVVVDGVAHTLALEDGVASLSLARDAHLSIRASHPVWARAEARYLVPIEARTGPLETRIEGVVGRAGESAGLELVVANPDPDHAVGAPRVEVVLPAGATLDEAALEAIRASALEVVPPDGAGVLRIALASLPGAGERRIPLAFRWAAAGRVRGLAVASYDASRPWRIGVLPGRSITIGEAQP